MSKNSQHLFYFDEFCLDTDEKVLRRDGAVVGLTPKALELLIVLVEKHGGLVTKDEIMARVWPDSFVEESNLTFTISVLRKALGDDKNERRFIETVPRRGYRFVSDVRQATPEQPELVVVEHTLTRITIEENEGDESPVTATDRRHLTPGPPISPNASPRITLFAVCGVLAFALGGMYWMTVRQRNQADPPPMKVVPITSSPANEYGAVISPDGKMTAYCVRGGDHPNTEIYVKLLDAGTPIRITHTREGVGNIDPAWSPDGTHLVFTRLSMHGESESGIFTVPALGGGERKIAPAGHTRTGVGLDWSPDGKTIACSLRASDDGPKAIQLISLADLSIRQLTFPKESVTGDSFPAFSPDGGRVAFLRSIGTDLSLLMTVPVTGGEPTSVTKDPLPQFGFDWSADGQTLVFSRQTGSERSLWRIPASGGEPAPIFIGGGSIEYPSISNQGNRMVFTRRFVDTDIWEYPITEGTTGPEPVKRLFSSRVEAQPVYSPNGKYIAFVSDRSGSPQIWIADDTGANQRQLTNVDGSAEFPQWSPDGQQIAFTLFGGKYSQIATVTVESGRITQLTALTCGALFPAWSRDGNWVLFALNCPDGRKTGRIPATGGDPLWMTASGGISMIESPDDGRQYLLHRDENARERFFKRLLPDGTETTVFDLQNRFNWGWSNQGIYFSEQKAPPFTIQFHRFADGAVKTVGNIAAQPTVPNSPPTFSPDGKKVLMAREAYRLVDVMLVDNWQ